MLRSLELENFLLFEKAVFEFSPGLNAVSGETGAGKSLIARALGLSLGGRGGFDVVRAGCDEARVRAVFVLDGPRPEDPAIGEDGVLEIERRIRREGGGLTVNGRSATAQSIRHALAPLVDFAAQNEHVRLAESAYQLELLDAFGRLEGPGEAYRQAYRAAESLAKRLRAGREERELVRLRLERARGELADVDKMEYDPANDDNIEERIRELSNAAAVVQAAAEATLLLETGEPPALEALTSAWRTLERLAGVSPRLAEAGRDLSDALERVGSAVAKLAGAGQGLDAEPARLDALISRSEKLKALARRFSCRVEELPTTRERLAAEIEELSGWDAGEGEIRARLDALLPDVADRGRVLGTKRREAAKKLARRVNRELAGLGMEQAGFEVVFEPLWTEDMGLDAILDAGVSGLDEVNFFISPNPGESPSAIAGAASGGESSRAILALKSALSAVHRPELMFLDEVDAGVGARLGRELGVKLKEMSATRQVIVITHLPQIAACAARHLKVAKKTKGGRTVAWVESLDGEARIHEVASMIHGSSAGEITLRQAREMLNEGGAGA